MGQPWLRCEANSCDECPKLKDLKQDLLFNRETLRQAVARIEELERSKGP